MFWYHLPVPLGKELIHSYCAERIVHLTAGDGWPVLAGLPMRVPGVYVMMSQEHLDGVWEFCTQQVFMMCQLEESGWLYSPRLVKAISDHDAAMAPAPTKGDKD